jgi:pyruvate/2-oxoglutarate dehydrogenase complex dihydrolipoamide dehydrogenase (E3) component
VPTTVYTPLEYGACGLSEEAAVEKYGAEGVEVYHTAFRPLEWAVPQRADDRCYAKLVCHRKEKGGVAGERVVGLHLCGPHAGEITQGFAVAIKAGATKADFDRTVGIHPTVAEGLTVLSTTKRSSETAKQADC